MIRSPYSRRLSSVIGVVAAVAVAATVAVQVASGTTSGNAAATASDTLVIDTSFVVQTIDPQRMFEPTSQTVPSGHTTPPRPPHLQMPSPGSQMRPVSQRMLRSTQTFFGFPPHEAPIYAVYASRRHVSAKVRSFVDFLAARFEGQSLCPSIEARLRVLPITRMKRAV